MKVELFVNHEAASEVCKVLEENNLTPQQRPAQQTRAIELIPEIIVDFVVENAASFASTIYTLVRKIKKPVKITSTGNTDIVRVYLHQLKDEKVMRLLNEIGSKEKHVIIEIIELNDSNN